MKRSTLIFLYFVCSFGMIKAQHFENKYVGVWANEHSELLQTDSVVLFFEREKDGSLSSTLVVPSRNIHVTTTFNADSTISTGPGKPLSEKINANGTLTLGKQTLKKVETIKFTRPYDMPKAENSETIGERLQEWRLGVYIDYNPQSGTYYMEANTNRHMFVYAYLDNIKYFRAAVTRNVNKGTLFHQNIRMMMNNNTKEFTREIHPNHLTMASTPLHAEESKFIPNTCYFDPNGGIYWSYISHTADEIILNGCGETYYVKRRKKDHPLLEWIAYERQ